MKNRIRLTESQLHKVIKESIQKILREGAFDPDDEEYKDFQNELSWEQFDMDNNDPIINFEKTAHSRTPLQGNGNLNLYGNARDENWNVQDTHGLNAMNAMSDNPYTRHQAQHMGSTLKQSVDNGMNDMSKLGESKLHEISYGGTSKQGNPYDNWDGGFGDNWSDEQWAEYEKKRDEKYKDMPNRDYFNESKGFANKEQSKMMDWKKKRTDAFYDKDGKPISKKYTPRGKDGIPKPIKVKESQLHNIVKESINKVLQEAYNSVQYANLAGQANGALNSFGGKVKGFFNPQWKARKQRQEKLFANGGNSQYNRVGSSAIADNTPNSSYQHDYFTNQYNQERSGEAPYEIQRSQYDMPNAFNIQRGKQDGQTISKQDFRREYGVNGKNIEGYDDVTYENSRLNNAYNIGRNATMGKNKGKKARGGYRLDGTGIKNGAFQHYGEDY